MGTTLALVGSALLVVAELVSIPFADQRIDAVGPQLVMVTFVIATVLSAVGFLVAGVTTLQSTRSSAVGRHIRP